MEIVSKTGRGMPPSAILAIIGGAIMLAGGILAISVFSVWNQQMWSMYGWGGLMMGGSSGWGMTMPGGTGFMWWAVGTSSAISIGAGAMSTAGGIAIHRKPESSSGWGILVASIIGLLGMSGFFIGPLLGIIGGILALTKK